MHHVITYAAPICIRTFCLFVCCVAFRRRWTPTRLKSLTSWTGGVVSSSCQHRAECSPVRTACAQCLALAPRVHVLASSPSCPMASLSSGPTYVASPPFVKRRLCSTLFHRVLLWCTLFCLRREGVCVLPSSFQSSDSHSSSCFAHKHTRPPGIQGRCEERHGCLCSSCRSRVRRRVVQLSRARLRHGDGAGPNVPPVDSKPQRTSEAAVRAHIERRRRCGGCSWLGHATHLRTVRRERFGPCRGSCVVVRCGHAERCCGAFVWLVAHHVHC
jgi:hypothetical protein